VGTETIINLQGSIVSITTTPTTITFEKGDQFQEGFSDPTMVLKGGYMLSLAAHRRHDMYERLDAWIKGVEE
jgi:hypothetical protein